MDANHKTLWELLWDYDPNALIVTDDKLVIRVVNPAFCMMFHQSAEALLGKDASTVLGNMDAFLDAWDEDRVRRIEERIFPDIELAVKMVIFPIRDQGVIGCILVDMTNEAKHREEMLRVKRETLERIQGVVNRQMKVAQEIASLLGETTAETKTSLLHLIDTVDQELR